MKLAPIAALALLAGSTVAAAQSGGPGSFARFSSPHGGMIVVELAYVARDNCQAILSTRRAAPPGVQTSFRNTPLSVVVGPDPDGCHGDRVVRQITRVAGGPEPDLVEIFFQTPDGRLLKHERVAVQRY